MFFFHTEGGMRYVALEPFGHGYICMGTYQNLGTEDHPVYYFDGRYTDHMIETAMVDPVFAFQKHTPAETKRFIKTLFEKKESIKGSLSLYSYENTHWLIQNL